MADYDAILVVSLGGPEGPRDVMPILRNVVRGRNVPPERLRQVARQYELFGGVSPINAETRRLTEALRKELEGSGHDMPVYWGTRNWHPFLTDTPKKMAAVCDYEAQLRETARLVAVGLDNPFELVYQSRSGPPDVPSRSHPRFVRMIRQLIDEHLAGGGPRACAPACCMPISGRN